MTYHSGLVSLVVNETILVLVLYQEILKTLSIWLG